MAAILLQHPVVRKIVAVSSGMLARSPWDFDEACKEARVEVNALPNRKIKRRIN
jgi:hypothetical protein